MKELKVTLVERVPRTFSVESFRFQPQERLSFLPGQFGQLIFDEQNRNNSELNKYLSFSASPSREYLEFTKRLSQSRFSQSLKDLKIGDEVLLKGPLGNCIFKQEYKRIGFLIGGIGITPVISIIEYVIQSRFNTDIFLLYSNRTEEEIAFKEELDYWQKLNKNLKVYYVITDCVPKDKNCIYGRIDQTLLLSKVDSIGERVFFIFGPPKMVEVMARLCETAGCSKENIKTENFVGY